MRHICGVCVCEREFGKQVKSYFIFLKRPCLPQSKAVAAVKDAQTLLPLLYRKLLRIFGGIQITSGRLSAGDAKPAELLELGQCTAPLVPEMVDAALKFLLEVPEQQNKT